MGCSLQKSADHIHANKRRSINTHTCNIVFYINIVTPDKKPSLDVFNPMLGKVVSVPILVPASKSSIMMRRST